MYDGNLAHHMQVIIGGGVPCEERGGPHTGQSPKRQEAECEKRIRSFTE